MKEIFSKYFIPLFIVHVLLLPACREKEDHPATAVATIYLSSESGSYSLSRQPDLPLAQSDSDFSKITIRVEPVLQYQKYFGFGESFDGSTVYNLKRMTPAKRTELLGKLIDPQLGAGFNLFRICIGTSDFTPQSWGWYSLDDMPQSQTDPELSHFSIQKDIDNGIIAVLKVALKLAAGKNVELQFVATPWSPPAWMKTKSPYSMAGGELKPVYNAIYAKYLFSFLKAYQEAGIPVYAITVQNEPGWVTSTPSTAMNAAQEAEIILHLRSLIDADGTLQTKILAYDWNFHDISHPLELLANPEVRDAIDGVAFHAYDWLAHDEKNLQEIRGLYPEMPLYHTERAFWNADGMGDIIKMFRNGTGSYIGWVTLLDADNTDGSGREDEMFPGTPSAPYFVLEASDKDSAVENYVITSTYYLKQQFSRFIQPGARRVYSDAGVEGLSNVAFLNPDGRLALVVVNQKDVPQEVRVITDGKQFVTEIPAKTVGSYSWKATNTSPEVSLNLAEGKTVAASSAEGGNLAAYATDGNFRTRWASTWSDNQWIRVDLTAVMQINRIVLDWEDAYGKEYLVQISDDATNWKTIYHEQYGYQGEHAYYAGITGRYVKITCIKRGTSWGYSLFELKVY
jgi:O-glycosyl hydrolase